jgi:hypothetical protein
VRRRLRHLAETGVCVLTESGAIVPQAFLASPAYLESCRILHERMWTFYREARAAGLVGSLPDSRYPVDAGVPVRAAIRLAADFLLRTTELVAIHFGDVISGLIGLSLLCTATGPEARRRPMTISALADRLAMPIETVRRHALDLAAQGRCHRERRGLVIAQEALDRPPLAHLLRENSAHAQRLFAGLAERGVVAAWERIRPDSASEAVARA